MLALSGGFRDDRNPSAPGSQVDMLLVQVCGKFLPTCGRSRWTAAALENRGGRKEITCPRPKREG